MANGSGVSQTHRDYETYARKWKRCRDVSAGQDAIYNAGIEYLPKLKNEDEASYQARLQRTPFYNASWRTLAGFVGMLFRKPPTLEVPKQMDDLLADVTQSGVTFNSFAQDCALEDLEVSRLGVLVDYPKQHVNEDGSPVKLTKAQTEALNLRPIMIKYKAETIIDWKFTFIANKNVLTQVRLLELADVPVNEFESKEELRVKVLDLIDGKYRIRIFNEDNGLQIGTDVYPEMNGKPLSEIPFYFIGPDGSDAELDEPILIDLFDLNIKHFQVSADYEHGCHMTALPTPVISGHRQAMGADGKPIVEEFNIGSMSAWVFEDPNTSATFLEFTGAGLKTLENNLDRKEAQMAAIGARMLAPEKKAAEAAQTLAMRNSGENSVLSAIAIAVSEGLTKALETFREWAGISGTCKFEINREFVPMAVDPQMLTAWLALCQGGKMSFESLFELLKRADLIDAETTFDDEQGRIDAEAPPAPPAATGFPALPLDPNAPPSVKPALKIIAKPA